MPAYVRFKLKNILDVDLESLNAEVLATLSISIDLRGFKEHTVTTYSKVRYQHLYKQLTTQILVKFCRDDTIRLNKENTENLMMRFKEEDDSFTFTIWKVFNLNIMTEKYWLSPF